MKQRHSSKKLQRNTSTDMQIQLNLSVDSILLKNAMKEGTFLYKNDNEGMMISSLQELPKDVPFFTENNNKVIKVSDTEVHVISPSGDVVNIPIPKEEVIPVLLDRTGDQTVACSAEAVLEDITGKRLYSGIPLVREGEESGKVIFSLRELPIGVFFLVSELPPNKVVRICRTSEDILINDQHFQPAKESQLLSGNPVSPIKVPKNDHEDTPKLKISPRRMEPTLSQEEQEYEDWKKKFMSMQYFDEELEKAKATKAKLMKERLKEMMSKYVEHYDKQEDHMKRFSKSLSSPSKLSKLSSPSDDSYGPLFSPKPLLDAVDDQHEKELFSTLFVQQLVSRTNLDPKRQAKKKEMDEEHDNEFYKKYEKLMLSTKFTLSEQLASLNEYRENHKNMEGDTQEEESVLEIIRIGKQNRTILEIDNASDVDSESSDDS